MAEKQVNINIKKLLNEYGISLRELSRLADIRHATLSELANNKRKSIHFDHIKRISEALNITDIRKIIEIETIEDEKE
ncbi:MULTISPECIES: helix-turn-helix transcriptional regulator [unclassified Mesobacillus]|uniref:helix-turn-helix domain-containing protein n=1 Tax=unclassified Mesobacillus TaxID=2675270 RepID=UPI00203C30D3|nr:MULTISPECIES: helix-turn-helix transcriptional regulator [unclassified Mesobacillus]MCM3124423.1 helix-turn-helix transcriptional regulator [Mesobacillus sp. MER 33]MCM3234867.1 helix-turn-helix transcriptional regulator [Mesobacillus sp. MER 48]